MSLLCSDPFPNSPLPRDRGCTPWTLEALHPDLTPASTLWSILHALPRAPSAQVTPWQFPATTLGSHGSLSSQGMHLLDALPS